LAAFFEKEAEIYGEDVKRIWRKEGKYHAFSVNEHTTNIFSPCMYAMAIPTNTRTVGEEGQN
jgi:hypothetical protein